MRNQRGFSMVEVMVGAGLLGGLALGVAQIAKNMGFVQNVSGARADELELRNEVKTILENPEHCGASMLALPPFRKTQIDQYANGEGLPVVLSVKTPTGNIKKYEAGPANGPQTQWNHFGKIRITSMKLVMDTGVGSNYAPNQTFHTDLGRLVIETERPEGAGSKNKRLDFQVIVGMQTNAASTSSVINCKSKNEANPCDALNLEQDGISGDCRPKTATVVGAPMAPSGDIGWGGWGGWSQCPSNTLACGIRTRVEGSQGGGDDTAMNAARLQCCVNTEGMGRINNSEIGSSESGWGDWGDPHYCSAKKNNYINAYRMRIEGSQGGGDDTALNAIEMRCSDGAIVTSATKGWGNWRAWATCPSGQYICGMRSKIEGGQGGGDDTAMNNMQVRCCSVAP